VHVQGRLRDHAVILVTGAAGKTGVAVIRALAAAGQPVRALVRRPDQMERVYAAGAQDALAGDLRDPEILGQAARGVHAVYHICPNLLPDETAICEEALRAARLAGAGKFIYHSVLHPQIQAMPHHWNKMLAEAAVIESGLEYTILQPASYMQNTLAGWRRIIEQGVYEVPYAAGTRLGMVDLDDVAAVAATVLTASGHSAAVYELAGPEAMTQPEVAAVFEQQLGRSVRIGRVSIEEWSNRARASGMGTYPIETLVKMFRHYEQYGFWGNPRTLGYLLGRSPTGFAAFVERTRHQEGA
jgi:NAD(P)H dehydrogenase (quinone)